eukprot:763008-Hanusia_phi.AAC.5
MSAVEQGQEKRGPVEAAPAGRKSMFITQNANLTSKQHKTVRLPRIERSAPTLAQFCLTARLNLSSSANKSAADVSSQSSQSTELLKANREVVLS